MKMVVRDTEIKCSFVVEGIQIESNLKPKNYISPVTSHLSQTPTAAATDPPPANSPTMHSRLVCKDHQIKDFFTQQICETAPKKSLCMPILAISFDQKSQT